MQDALTAEQVARYRRDGFLAVPGLLDPGELERWREVVADAVAQRLGGDGGMHNQSDPDSFYAQVFTQCVRLADTHEELRSLVYDVRLARAAGTLAGVDGIRVWHDQALIKPPFGNATAWHLDNPYWSFSSRDAISVWIALDDATLENGCMWYLPGTHLTARDENAGIGQNQADLFRAYPEWREIEPIAVPVAAGSAVFHNGLVAHGAGANMTNRPRRAMTCAYMPDGATFNGTQNVLPQELFESLAVGDPLVDAVFNPLVWSRQRDG